jgi:polar amino acid transport system substrate-binding protein
MKHTKKIIAVLLCVMSVVLCFAGCSSAGEAEEITSDTMLIAYTGDNSPFIYEENGEVKGFDVDLFKKIFNSIKDDYTNYKFVKVDEDYQLGEDVYCVDEDGNDCIAYVMIGGVQKNVSDINNTYSFTQDVINNRVVTITLDGYGVSSYTDLNGKAVGVVGDVAKSALDKNATIENGCKSVTEYTTDKISDAVADLNSGKINALVIDEFNLYTNVENVDTFKVLDGELENISYVYATEKYNGYVDSINEAIYELQSPDYNDADEFTPLVEQYFGYNASSFEYSPVEE